MVLKRSLCFVVFIAACAAVTHTEARPRASKAYMDGFMTMMPSPLHDAVRDMVRGCLGVESRPFRWATAEQIVLDSLPDNTDDGGVLAYGVVTSETNGNRHIVIQRPYWFHVGILSHELVHFLANDPGEHSPAMEACTIPVPGILPSRPVPPDSVAAARARVLANR